MRGFGSLFTSIMTFGFSLGCFIAGTAIKKVMEYDIENPLGPKLTTSLANTLLIVAVALLGLTIVYLIKYFKSNKKN